MTLADRLLAQLDARGLWLERGDEDTLLLKGPAAEKTPDVVAACKAFKVDLLAAIGGPVPVPLAVAPAFRPCSLCNGEVSVGATAEDMRRVCGRVGTRRTSGCPFHADG